jgi:hypothetical protein
MTLLEGIGEVLFHPILDGAERAWDLCFSPSRRKIVFDRWRGRCGWHNALTAFEVVTSIVAVGLIALVVVVPVVLLTR